MELNICRKLVLGLEGLVCFGRENYYAKMCPQKNLPVHLVDSSKRAASGGKVESEELFIGTLTGPRSAENSVWFSNLLIGGTTVKFKLDTGAEANVLPFSVYSKL